MISLEMAKKLKEAGLEWEPQIGDWYYFGDDGELHLLRVATPRPVPEVVYSAPRLDQLLAEIEGLGYHDFYLSRAEEGWHICLWLPGNENLYPDLETDYYDTPTDAAASALLWIYERRN